MSLTVNPGQNSSSFSKHPAIGLDRGAAPWAHGLYLEQLPLPTSVLPGPGAGPLRQSLRLGVGNKFEPLSRQ